MARNEKLTREQKRKLKEQEKQDARARRDAVKQAKRDEKARAKARRKGEHVEELPYISAPAPGHVGALEYAPLTAEAAADGTTSPTEAFYPSFSDPLAFETAPIEDIAASIAQGIEDAEVAPVPENTEGEGKIPGLTGGFRAITGSLFPKKEISSWATNAGIEDSLPYIPQSSEVASGTPLPRSFGSGAQRQASSPASTAIPQDASSTFYDEGGFPSDILGTALNGNVSDPFASASLYGNVGIEDMQERSQGEGVQGSYAPMPKEDGYDPYQAMFGSGMGMYGEEPENSFTPDPLSSSLAPDIIETDGQPIPASTAIFEGSNARTLSPLESDDVQEAPVAGFDVPDGTSPSTRLYDGIDETNPFDPGISALSAIDWDAAAMKHKHPGSSGASSVFDDILYPVIEPDAGLGASSLARSSLDGLSYAPEERYDLLALSDRDLDALDKLVDEKESQATTPSAFASAPSPVSGSNGSGGASVGSENRKNTPVALDAGYRNKEIDEIEDDPSPLVYLPGIEPVPEKKRKHPETATLSVLPPTETKSASFSMGSPYNTPQGSVPSMPAPAYAAPAFMPQDPYASLMAQAMGASALQAMWARQAMQAQMAQAAMARQAALAQQAAMAGQQLPGAISHPYPYPQAQAPASLAQMEHHQPGGSQTPQERQASDTGRGIPHPGIGASASEGEQGGGGVLPDALRSHSVTSNGGSAVSDVEEGNRATDPYMAQASTVPAAVASQVQGALDATAEAIASSTQQGGDEESMAQQVRRVFGANDGEGEPVDSKKKSVDGHTEVDGDKKRKNKKGKKGKMKDDKVKEKKGLPFLSRKEDGGAFSQPVDISDDKGSALLASRSFSSDSDSASSAASRSFGRTGALDRVESATKHVFASLISIVLGAALIFFPISSALSVDWGKEGIEFDYWQTHLSVDNFGLIPSLLRALQLEDISEPVGYNSEQAQQMQASLASLYDTYIESSSARQAAVSQFETTRPNIICVMNESFSDLSFLAPLQDVQTGSSFLADASAIAKGKTSVSVYGGGTCNSEFEALTSNALGYIGGGIDPYAIYDLQGIDTLPKQFKSMGYGTCAIHPELATNWKRDVVYPAIGFDEFLARDSFVGAETSRGRVRDFETYAKVIERIQQSDEPQFIFDLTMMGHGGYETGLIDQEDELGISIEGADDATNANVDEYLSSVSISNKDLEQFVRDLSALSEPCVLVFFGDHQPGFSWWLQTDEEKASGDISVKEALYQTDYFIWANYSVDGSAWGGSDEEISGNDVALASVESTGAQEGEEDLPDEDVALANTVFGMNAGKFERAIDEALEAKKGNSANSGNKDAGSKESEKDSANSDDAVVADGDKQEADANDGGDESTEDGSVADGEEGTSGASDVPIDAATLYSGTMSPANLLGWTMTFIGAPLTEYEKASYISRYWVEAVNIYGYLDPEGKWHSLDEAKGASDALVIEEVGSALPEAVSSLVEQALASGLPGAEDATSASGNANTSRDAAIITCAMEWITYMNFADKL